MHGGNAGRVALGGRSDCSRRFLRPRAARVCAGARPRRRTRRRCSSSTAPPDADHRPPASTAIKALGTAQRLRASTRPPDATDITAANLANYRAVVFLNTPGDLLDAEQEAALAAVHRGRQRLPRHRLAPPRASPAAVLQRPDRRAPGRGEPDDAPPTQRRRGRRPRAPGDARPAARVDPHRRLVPRGPRARPARVHTVARYRAPDAAAGDGTDAGDTDTPISWCRDYQRRPLLLHRHGPHGGELRRGRLQASTCSARSSGPRASSAAAARRRSTPTTRARRVISAGAEPTGLADQRRVARHRRSPRTAGCIYIGRGDCRTDAERGALIGLPTLSRASSTTRDPNVGIGCGTVHVWDPSQPTTGTDQQRRHAGRHARGLRRRRHGRRAHRTRPTTRWSTACSASPPSPDFAHDGPHLPAVLPELQPGHDAARAWPTSTRRISKMSRAAHLALHDQPADQEARPRLRGRGSSSTTPRSTAAATSAAAWASTPRATSTSPPATRTRRRARTATRATTRTPSARPAPATEAVERALRRRDVLLPGRAPHRGQHQRLQRQDAADQADRDAPGRHAARRSASARRTRSRAPTPRTARTCSTATRAAAARPSPRSTRWACATRARLSIDPKTDIPYTAWVGPDAGAPSATSGPSTYENAAQVDARRQLRLALLHGQQAGLPRPRRRRQHAAHRQRPPGYVAGGPATGGTDGWYDCDNLRQRLAQQHRPRRAPAHDRHRHGRGQGARHTTSGTAAATRSGQRLPGVPAPARRRHGARLRRATRRSCARTRPPTALTSWTARSTATTAMRATTRAAGPSTGTAAGSCQTTAARASSTACCSTRTPTRTAASRCTPTACATRSSAGRATTWTPSSGPTAPGTCRRTTASSARGRTSASTGSTTPAAPTPRWPRRRAPRSARAR